MHRIQPDNNKQNDKQHLMTMVNVSQISHCFVVSIFVCSFRTEIFTEAGFDGEWSASTESRSRQRQVQVEANVASNPNRPTEYRTVTASSHPQPSADPEAEERKSTSFTSFAPTNYRFGFGRQLSKRPIKYSFRRHQTRFGRFYFLFSSRW